MDAHFKVLGAVRAEIERLGRELSRWFPGQAERERCLDLQFNADRVAGNYRAFLESQALSEREARATYAAAGRDFDAEQWKAQA